MLFLAYKFSCLGSLKLCYLYIFFIFACIHSGTFTSITDKLYFMITFHFDTNYIDVNRPACKPIKVASILKVK